MKVLSLLIVSLSLFMAGCESMESSTSAVKERWNARNTGKVRVLTAEPKVVYEAARASIESLGFRITRGGAAQGRIDAVNGLQSGDSLQSSRQIAMKVRITKIGEGTELRAFLTEVIEDDSSKRAGMGTETALIDTPLYEVFFRQVEQSIGKK